MSGSMKVLPAAASQRVFEFDSHWTSSGLPSSPMFAVTTCCKKSRTSCKYHRSQTSQIHFAHHPWVFEVRRLRPDSQRRQLERALGSWLELLLGPHEQIAIVYAPTQINTM